MKKLMRKFTFVRNILCYQVKMHHKTLVVININNLVERAEYGGFIGSKKRNLKLA